MTSTDWQESAFPAPVIRRGSRGRSDFQDSMLQARRELQAQERRRSEAMTHALRDRPLASDPAGKRFHAAQKKAIAARRAENALLDANQRKSREHAVDLLGQWHAETPVKVSSHFALYAGQAAAVLLVVVGACATLAHFAFA